MDKFRIPRKEKKKLQKKLGIKWKPFWNGSNRESKYLWLTQPQKQWVESLIPLINYPQKATQEEVTQWYQNNYPDKMEDLIPIINQVFN